jgi:hypothetical protein
MRLFRVYFDNGTSKEIEAASPDDIRTAHRKKLDQRLIKKIKRVKDDK